MISMSCTSLTPSERSDASDRIGGICRDSSLVLSLNWQGENAGQSVDSFRCRVNDQHHQRGLTIL